MNDLEDINEDEVVARPRGWWIAVGFSQMTKAEQRLKTQEVCVWMDHHRPGWDTPLLRRSAPSGGAADPVHS